MREIKFRGIRKDNNNIVYGNLIYYADGSYILPNDSKDAHHETIMVFTETVGQFTGIKDKNGKEIYEGDIVKVDSYDYVNNVDTVYFELIKWYPYGWNACLSNDVKIVGNIHEATEEQLKEWGVENP